MEEDKENEAIAGNNSKTEFKDESKQQGIKRPIESPQVHRRKKNQDDFLSNRRYNLENTVDDSNFKMKSKNWDNDVNKVGSQLFKDRQQKREQKYEDAQEIYIPVRKSLNDQVFLPEARKSIHLDSTPINNSSHNNLSVENKECNEALNHHSISERSSSCAIGKTFTENKISEIDRAIKKDNNFDQATKGESNIFTRWKFHQLVTNTETPLNSDLASFATRNEKPEEIKANKADKEVDKLCEENNLKTSLDRKLEKSSDFQNSAIDSSQTHKVKEDKIPEEQSNKFIINQKWRYINADKGNSTTPTFNMKEPSPIKEEQNVISNDSTLNEIIVNENDPLLNKKYLNSENGEKSLDTNYLSTKSAETQSPTSLTPGGKYVPVQKRQSLMEEDMFKDCWNDFSNTLQDILNRLQELSSELGYSKLLKSKTSPDASNNTSNKGNFPKVCMCMILAYYCHF